MNKRDAAVSGPIAARVVHRSVMVDVKDIAQVIKLMLNVPAGSREFEAGTDIAFSADGSGGDLRYYTVESVGEVPFEDTIDITIYVRSSRHGERSGVAGELSGLRRGDTVQMYGPYPYPFYLPMGSRSNIVLIGAGSGMVPFRWLARKVHARKLDWMGKVLMLEGADTGLEHLYMNDPFRDQAQFFDQTTRRAFDALKTRYSAIALDREESKVANMEALWRLLGQGSVYVYLAGYRAVAESLDEAMIRHLRIADRWHDAKAALIRDGHWLEALYD